MPIPIFEQFARLPPESLGHGSHRLIQPHEHVHLDERCTLEAAMEVCAPSLRRQLRVLEPQPVADGPARPAQAYNVRVGRDASSWHSLHKLVARRMRHPSVGQGESLKEASEGVRVHQLWIVLS